VILASRIPTLTERLRAATIRAAEDRHGPPGTTETAPAPERGPVEPLERLGDKAALERVAA
jgi:hypothetical protein